MTAGHILTLPTYFPAGQVLTCRWVRCIWVKCLPSGTGSHVCCLVAASCGKNWFQRRANFWQWKWRIEELFKSLFLHPKVFIDWAVLIVISVTSKKMTGCIIYLLCRRISSVFKVFLASVGSTSRSLYISVVPNQLVWRSRETKVCHTKSSSFTDFYSFMRICFVGFFFLL